MHALARHHDSYLSTKFSRSGLLGVAFAHVFVIALLVFLPASPVMQPGAVLSISLLPAEAELPPAPATSAASRPPPRSSVRLAIPAPTPTPVTPSVAATPEPTPAVTETTSAAVASTTTSTPIPTPTPTLAPTSTPALASPPRFDADYLDNPKPVYPHIARRMGEEGRVVLRVRVAASGQPLDVQVQTGSGSPRLDQAAMDSVRRWRFVPARLGAEAVAATVLVPIAFSLKD